MFNIWKDGGGHPPSQGAQSWPSPRPPWLCEVSVGCCYLVGRKAGGGGGWSLEAHAAQTDVGLPLYMTLYMTLLSRYRTREVGGRGGKVRSCVDATREKGRRRKGRGERRQRRGARSICRPPRWMRAGRYVVGRVTMYSCI